MAVRKQAPLGVKANVHSFAHLDLIEALVTDKRRPAKSTTVRAFTSLRRTVLSDLYLVDAKAKARHAQLLDAAHIANRRLIDECVSRGRLQARLPDDALDQLNMDLLRIGEAVENDDELHELEANLEATEEELLCLVSDDENSSGDEPFAEL